MTYPNEPVHTPIGARLRERTQPLAPNDATFGFAHAYLTEAIGRLSQQAQEVADPEGDAPPLSTLLNPDTCPDWALPWLAQFVGIKLPAGLTPADARAIIHDVAGFSRGTPAALRAAAQLYLTGNKEVFFRERDGGDPYRLEVVTQANEVPPSDRGEPTNLVTNPSAELTASFGLSTSPATTPVNLATNPSGELTPTFTTLAASSAGQPAATIVDTTAWAAAGTHASRYTVTRDDAATVIMRTPIGTGGIPVIGGHWYAIRMTIHPVSISQGNTFGLQRLTAYWYTAAAGAATPGSSPGVNQPVALGDSGDIYMNVQAPADAAFLAPAHTFSSGAAIPGSTYVVDADALVVVDLGTVAPPSSGQTTQPQDVPPYFDGSFFAFMWNGAAHASTSKPSTTTRTRTQDWAKAGTWSTRFTQARDDGAVTSIRSDNGTNQGTGGKFAVDPTHYYAARVRVRMRETSGPIDYAYMGFIWYQPDNSTAAGTSGSGPRVQIQAGREADVLGILKPNAGAGWVALRPTFKVAAGWVTLDVDVDALALYDLGTQFTGPTGLSTRPEDVPPYIDGDTPGAAWNGAAHASTSHPPVTTLVQNALLAAKPGGLILSYRMILGWDYQEMTAKGGTYAAQTLAYPTYKRLKEGP